MRWKWQIYLMYILSCISYVLLVVSKSCVGDCNTAIVSGITRARFIFTFSFVSSRYRRMSGEGAGSWYFLHLQVTAIRVRDLNTPAYTRWHRVVQNCTRTIFAGFARLNFGGFDRSWAIIVLVIRFVCSTRLRRVCWRIRVTDLVCGEELSSWTDSNCVPLSDKIIFGWKIILSATACVTTAAIARHRGCNFTHFEKRSCIVKSHVCSFFDLNSVPIKFIETFCHYSWRSRARIRPVSFIIFYIVGNSCSFIRIV